MYQIMIVDDEPLILAGIASLLDWEKQECVIAGKAGNGQQALKLMEEQRPDIVITDIKMPGMDGISFMKAVKERGWDDIVFIILTNLEEFNLARQALSLGAVEYLVKMELTEEKLSEALKLAKERCELTRLANEKASPGFPSKADRIRRLIEQLLVGDEPAEGFKEAEETLKEPVLVIISFNYGFEGFSEGFTREDQKKVISFAENIIGQMTGGYFDSSCLVRRELDSLVLVLSAAGVENYQTVIRSLGEKIRSVVKDYFEVPVSVAVSTRKESLREFPALLYEAMSATSYYFGHSGDPVVFYSRQCETDAGHPGSFHIGLLKKDLSQAIALNDSSRLRQVIGQLTQLLEEYHPSREQAVNACANLYFFIASFFEDDEEGGFPYEVNIMEKLGRFGTLEQILKWIRWFEASISAIWDRRRDSRTDKIAEMVRDYVMTHYKERITLGQTAEALGISQGYLSTAFKKQTGESFTGFVSAVKIEKAKELIAGHQYMMYEISDMLGFDTPFYFSKVFKKIAGLSPKEYEAECFKAGHEV